MCSMTVACALIPRFHLLAAAADRQDLLSRPLALAPEPGGEQAVGEASGPAEAFGVRAGMRLGEALARCPELVLVPADPDRAETAWERVLCRLEGIGARVESELAGEAFFEADGMRGLWGGHLEGVLARTRRVLEVPARLGAAPTRFCAYAAASRGRGGLGPRRPGHRRGGRGRQTIVPAGAERAFLAPLPVSLLRARLPAPQRQADDLPAALERLGVRTLGELGALPPAAVADRFGTVGLRAHAMASGEDEPLRPRKPSEELVERLELPEAAFGSQLERALELLVDRLLAQPARRGRSLRRLRLEARLAAGGGWRTEVALRRASADPVRLGLALASKLGELPAPAAELRLRAVALGPAAHEQPALARTEGERRRERLGEAVRQARAAAGRDAVLRVLDLDVASRVPERRVLLAPFPEPSDGSRPEPSAGAFPEPGDA
jgi:protein ImuB